MKRFLLYISLILFISAQNFYFCAPAWPLEGTEYQIKAAMMVNFIQFVEWPQDPDHPADILTIGIIGKDNFGNAFNQIEGRMINERHIVIRYIVSLKDLSQCQAVFVSESESYRLNDILRCMKGLPVLSIGEADNFTQMGGVIRFFLEQNHVRFEINLTSAAASKLKISAKLLEIAKIVD